MQRAAGLTDVRWVDAAEAARVNPTLDPATFRGGTYAPGDGCVDPPRNVRAYSLAMQRAGVDVRERTFALEARGFGARPSRTAYRIVTDPPIDRWLRLALLAGCVAVVVVAVTGVVR